MPRYVTIKVPCTGVMRAILKTVAEHCGLTEAQYLENMVLEFERDGDECKAAVTREAANNYRKLGAAIAAALCISELKG